MPVSGSALDDKKLKGLMFGEPETTDKDSQLRSLMFGVTTEPPTISPAPLSLGQKLKADVDILLTGIGEQIKTWSASNLTQRIEEAKTQPQPKKPFLGAVKGVGGELTGMIPGRFSIGELIAGRDPLREHPLLTVLDVGALATFALPKPTPKGTFVPKTKISPIEVARAKVISQIEQLASKSPEQAAEVLKSLSEGKPVSTTATPSKIQVKKIAEVPSEPVPAFKLAEEPMIPPAKTVAKEPWEMTKQEWRAARDALRSEQANVYPETKLNWRAAGAKLDNKIAEIKRLNYGVAGQLEPVFHRNVVEKALSEGKPVLPEVLKDYPDLKPSKVVVGQEAGTVAGKYNPTTIEKFRTAKEGEIVGTVGDFINGSETRRVLADVLDTPVMVMNRAVQKGKAIPGRPDIIFKGGSGTYQGKPTIFVSQSPDFLRTLIEEASHQKRVRLGRPMTKQDFATMKLTDYETLPEELSAKKLSQYIETLDRPKPIPGQEALKIKRELGARLEGKGELFYIKPAIGDFVPVPNAKAIKIPKFEEFDFFVRRVGGDWQISEGKTGRLITTASEKRPTLQSAISEAQYKLRLTGKKVFGETIKQLETSSGLSPRYAQPKPEGGTTLYSGIDPELIVKLKQTWPEFVDEVGRKISDKTPPAIKRKIGKFLVYRYGQPKAASAAFDKYIADLGYSADEAVTLGKSLSEGLSLEEQRLTGAAIKGYKTDPIYQVIGGPARKTLDRLGLELVNRKLLSREAYAAHRKTYSPRMYRKWESRGWEPSPEVIDNAKLYMIDQMPEGTGMGDIDIIINEIIQGKETTFYVNKKPMRIRRPYAHRRKDIPEPIRELMGEIEEPAYPITKRIVEMKHDILLHDLFEQIGQNPEWVSDIPKPNFTQMAGGKNLGVLRDKYVLDNIASEINQIVRRRGQFEQVYVNLLSGWKWGKVVANPATHVRNVITNFMLQDFGGLSPARVDIYAKALKDLHDKGKYYQLAKKHGVIGSEWAQVEIKQMLDSFNRSNGDALDKAVSFMKTTIRKTSDIYQAEEQWFKIAKLMHNLESRKMPLTQALADAEKWVFNYRKVPDSVNFMRMYVAPFATFTYKAVPVVFETAVKHPVRLGKYLLMAKVVEDLAQRRLGWSDEDMQSYEQALPKYRRPLFGFVPRSLLTPLRSGQQPTEINLRFYNPLGMMTDADENLVNLVIGNPFFNVAVGMGLNVESFTGRKVVPEYLLESNRFWQDRVMEAWKLRLKFLAREGLPSLTPFSGYSAEQIREIFTGDRQAVPTLLQTLVGVKVQPVDLEQMEMSKQAQRDRLLMELGIDINRAMMKGDDKKVEELQEIEEAILEQ